MGTSARGMLRGCQVQATSGCWFLKSESHRLDRGVGDGGALQAQRQKGPCGRAWDSGTGTWARSYGTRALALGRGFLAGRQAQWKVPRSTAGAHGRQMGRRPAHTSLLFRSSIPADGAGPGLLLCLVRVPQSLPPCCCCPRPRPPPPSAVPTQGPPSSPSLQHCGGGGRAATLDGYRPAAAALPPGERREGPAPPGGISFLSRALSQAPPQRAPFTSRAFEEIWRTPSHPGQTRLKGSRAGRSVGTPGQPAGQNTGAAAHRRTGDCRKGAAWLQGPRGGNGTDTGQELKDLLLAQELGTPVPRTLTHSCVATALGRQGPGTASHCDAGRAPSCATSPSAPASSSLKWG